MESVTRILSMGLHGNGMLDAKKISGKSVTAYLRWAGWMQAGTAREQSNVIMTRHKRRWI